LRGDRRVQPISLHQLRMATNAFKEKRHQRHLFLLRHVTEYLGERIDITFTVIGRNLHAQQQHLRAAVLGLLDHRSKILLQLRRRLSAQAIVATQLDNHHVRLMLCKRRGQPCQASGAGITADGGVDHFIVETLLLEPLLQQGNPTFAGIQAETGTDTISMGASILIARDLSKVVPSAEGELTILHELSLELNTGDSLAIVGSSGSGKSTLLGLLAGLDLPSSGEVILAGQALSTLDEDQRARIRAEHVGFVFQSFQLLDSLNALENVMLPLELDGRKDARERAKHLLERVGLGQRLTHSPRQLSGGEQQRVAIARAFAAEPDVLFADEPTGNLDSHTGERISDLLFELNKESGTTLVLVTHDERLAHRCRRLIRLEAGLMVAPLEP
jgi:putative ABC transport system ATP-binding protein